jgi:hypothetical protein
MGMVYGVGDLLKTMALQLHAFVIAGNVPSLHWDGIDG